MKIGSSGIVILGGGLTGLSAGHVLSGNGIRAMVIEGDSIVGGISKTIAHNGFRFDLGGHRFFTKNRKIEAFVNDLMGNELVSVPRKSKIYMRGRYFDYPLRPLNAVSGMGVPATMRIMADYGVEKIKGLFTRRESSSLEDWVVGNFGRTMFDIYFKVYSEKVWGIGCDRISATWVDQRISGLSLAKAVKNALFRLNGREIPTLVDRFLYPELGIGRISDRLREEMERSGGSVFTDTKAERIDHSDFRVRGVVVRAGDGYRPVSCDELVSSIPITKLVKMLNPPPPERVSAAASRLGFRDLVVVAVMINKKRVSDLTWIYVPEKHIPFGRIHEPTNWSEKMAPEGKTLMVAEYFSFKGDGIWSMDDGALSELTIGHLERLGFITKREVLDTAIVRVPKAYPLFEVGYGDLCDTIYEYLGQFRNLHVAGRAGMFKYYNMDHAIESGFATAEKILRRQAPITNPEQSSIPKLDEFGETQDLPQNAQNAQR